MKTFINYIKRKLALFLHDELDKITMNELRELQRARNCGK